MLARMLHEAGTPAHRLEGLVTSCADRLGLSVSVFSLPTWIHISVGEEGRQRAISFRVDPGSPKLAMLEETYRVADRVAVGELDAEQGITALSRVRGRITRPRPLANCAGYALFSAGAAFFLGGSWAEMFASVPVGLIVGASIALAVGHRERELLAEFGAALIGTVIASFVVLGARRAGIEVSAATVCLAGLVTLLPGLSLATAMSELSTRNLASGSARLIGAITTLVVVGMGAGMGERVAQLIGLPQHTSFVVPVTQTAVVSFKLVVALLAIADWRLFFRRGRGVRAWCSRRASWVGFRSASRANSVVPNWLPCSPPPPSESSATATRVGAVAPRSPSCCPASRFCFQEALDFAGCRASSPATRSRV